MKKGLYTVAANEKLARDVYKMKLMGDTSAFTAPGQFLNIEIAGLYLRRPISVCDYDDNSVTIIYKVVGEGTEKMSRMKEGETLDVLTGLGNGFDVADSGEYPLVVGGGVGVPPLYRLTKELVKKGAEPTVVLGFNSAADVFYAEEFRAISPAVQVFVATADGSEGTKGFVTDVVKRLHDTGWQESYFYTCGPEPMLEALAAVCTGEGQLSYEERMGCGFGACMGCSCETKLGYKRICRDGPVMKRSEMFD